MTTSTSGITVSSLQFADSSIFSSDDVDPVSIKSLLTVSLLFLVTSNDSFQVVTLVYKLHVNINKVARSTVPPLRYV